MSNTLLMNGSTAPVNLRLVLRIGITAFTVLASFLPVFPALTFAQTVTTRMTSSGLGTTITPNGAIQDITGGTRPSNGPNLFHSFEHFSLAAGDTANFSNDMNLPTSRIISRVTGGEVSNIFGTLKTTNFGTAELVLINPYGMMFGSTAALNVGGAVHFSTADYVRMVGDTQFYAYLDGSTTQSTLSTEPIAAFGFFGSSFPADIATHSPSPATIGVQGAFLEVPQDQTLSMIGGDFQMVGGRLRSQSGQVQIASVASAGEVVPSQSGEPLALQMQGFSQLGQANFSAAATVTTTSAAGSGTVMIRGGRLMLDGINTVLGSSTLGAVNGATVGQDLQATERVEFANGAGMVSGVGGAGNGSAVVIDAPTVVFKTGAFITISTFGAGRSGNVSVKASTMDITDRALITAFTRSTGSAGTIDIEVTTGTGQLLISAGNAQGCCTGIQGSTGSFGQGTGSGPPIRIRAKNLTITGTAAGSAEISNTVFGQGAGGPLEILVSDTLAITGAMNPNLFTGLFANTFASGSAGTLSVTAGTLQMANYAQMQTTPVGSFATGSSGGATIAVTGNVDIRDGSLITSGGLLGIGNSGMLDLTAQNIMISGFSTGPAPFTNNFTGLLTSTNVGLGGELRVTADTLTVTNRGQLKSTTQGTKDAGSITLNLGNELRVTAGGQIFSGSLAATGNGGAINITADKVFVSGVNSTPFTDPTTGRLFIADSSISSQVQATTVAHTGRAGDIRISTKTLEVLDGAGIDSRTFGLGNAGTIDILATENVRVAGINQGAADFAISEGTNPESARSLITTSSESLLLGASATGRGGDIRIRTGVLGVEDGGLVDSSTTTPGPGGVITFTVSQMNLSGDAIIRATSDNGVSGSLAAATGKAGDIFVTASQSIQSEHSSVSTAALQGQGGDITLQAFSIRLNEGTTISTQSSGAGNSGNILIVANDLFRSQNSTVTTEAAQAFGGNIEIQNQRLVHLIDSTVSTSVKSGDGNGGNITIDPPFVMVDNSSIIARAVGGNGGNIFITAGTFLASPESVISASSQTGVSGQVLIQAPVSNLAGTLSRLSQTPLNAAELLTARCSARLREGNTSSLTLAGRDGVPAEPGSYRPTAFVASAYRPTGAPPVAARLSPATRPPLLLQSPSPEFYALRDVSPLPLGCGS